MSGDYLTARDELVFARRTFVVRAHERAGTRWVAVAVAVAACVHALRCGCRPACGHVNVRACRLVGVRVLCRAMPCCASNQSW